MSRGCPPRPGRPSSDDDLATISASLAAAIFFPGCRTRLETTATSPCLVICHPYLREPQGITAEAEFFWWARPGGLSRFSPRGGGISRAAGTVSVLLACLIVEQAGHGEAGAW